MVLLIRDQVKKMTLKSLKFKTILNTFKMCGGKSIPLIIYSNRCENLLPPGNYVQ